jgi:hypothetical protein
MTISAIFLLGGMSLSTQYLELERFLKRYSVRRWLSERASLHLNIHVWTNKLYVTIDQTHRPLPIHKNAPKI